MPDTLHLDVLETIEAAQRVSTGPALVAIIRPAFARLGVIHAVWGQATLPGGERAPRVDLGYSPPLWKAHYESERLALRDPIYPRALRKPTPFTWRSAHQDEPFGAEGVDIIEQARAFGLQDGFVMPIHHLNGSAGAVLLYSDQHLSWSPSQAVSAHMLSIYFASIAARLLESSPSAPRVDLSRRQRECLQWVRAGKTDWEIGRILGLSEHTVAEHLESARRRLGVKTRAQAVIEAIARGLITV